MLKQDDYIKGKLVEIGWRFGQSYTGGHIAGQMIMHVIANRVRAGWGNWLQMIDRVPAYMAENEVPPLVHPPVWQAEFIRLLQTVDGVFDGSVRDLSNGALYWGDLARIERDWFKNAIIHATKLINISDGGTELTQVPAHQRVANMNGLNFWK